MVNDMTELTATALQAILIQESCILNRLFRNGRAWRDIQIMLNNITTNFAKLQKACETPQPDFEGETDE
jgi:hypothetical protein